MVEQAIAYYEAKQLQHGGHSTEDEGTVRSILSACTDKSDREVEEALGSALARGYSCGILNDLAVMASAS